MLEIPTWGVFTPAGARRRHRVAKLQGGGHAEA